MKSVDIDSNQESLSALLSVKVNIQSIPWEDIDYSIDLLRWHGQNIVEVSDLIEKLEIAKRDGVKDEFKEKEYDFQYLLVRLDEDVVGLHDSVDIINKVRSIFNDRDFRIIVEFLKDRERRGSKYDEIISHLQSTLGCLLKLRRKIHGNANLTIWADCYHAIFILKIRYEALRLGEVNNSLVAYDGRLKQMAASLSEELKNEKDAMEMIRILSVALETIKDVLLILGI